MKKNVLMFVVDELTYDALGRQFDSTWTASPFLDSLKEKAVCAENMFSQAPFTENAMRGLLDGSNVMDKAETLPLYVSCDNNLFQTLEREGYLLYSLCMDFKYCEENTKKYGELQIISGAPIRGAEQTRLKYYKKLYRLGKLGPGQMQDVIHILEQSFRTDRIYLNMLCEDDPHIQYTKKVLHINNEEAKAALEKAIEEEETFQKDKEGYTKALLSGKCPIPETGFHYRYQRNMESKTLRKYVLEQFGPVCQNILKISAEYNRRNQKIPVGELWNAVKELMAGRGEQAARHIYYSIKNYITCNKEPSLLRLDDNFDKKKAIYTSYGTFEEYLEWQKGHRDKPYFAYLHFTDIHEPAVFINLRAKSKEEIEENASLIDQFLKTTPPGLKGQLNYYCAVRMIDHFLEEAFKRLEREGILDNTYIIITSDHGSSYLKKEIRNDLVNVFYQEQYHVPFYLYGKDLKSKHIDTFSGTKDIPQTICNLLGIELQGENDSKNLLDDHYHNEYSMQEYLGGGCPDIYGRPIRFCIHDEKWRLVYWVKLQQQFTQGKIMELYKVTGGRENKNNLFMNHKARKQSAYLLREVEKRFYQIQIEILKGKEK